MTPSPTIASRIVFYCGLSWLFLTGLSWVPDADAAGDVDVISGVQLASTGELTLDLDHALDQSRIKTEYNGNTIQLTIHDASIYPSKMISSNDGLLTKVFIYQYSPTEVRCRLSLKVKADAYQDRLRFNFENHTLKVKIDSTELVNPSSKPVKRSASTEAPQVKSSSNAEALHLNEKPTESAKASQVGDALTEDPILDKDLPAEKPALTGGKALPSVGSVLWKIGGVFCLLGFVLWSLMKLNGFRNSSEGNVFTKLRSSALKQKKKQAWVKVLSSHYLGPKKNITLVQVAGRVLVLGVTDTSIQMITELQPEGEGGPGELGAGAGAAAGASEFSKLLDTEKNTLFPMAGSRPGFSEVRSVIRNRLEGLKQL
jgi:flagellar biogenesis protein FliO